MRFHHLEQVYKNTHSAFLSGYVLGYVRRLDGSRLVIFENIEGILFMSDEQSLKPLSNPECKHDEGFDIDVNKMPDVFVCAKGCGFSMNFNPEKFPDGVSYRSCPSDYKPLPTIKSSKW